MMWVACGCERVRLPVLLRAVRAWHGSRAALRACDWRSPIAHVVGVVYLVRRHPPHLGGTAAVWHVGVGEHPIASRTATTRGDRVARVVAVASPPQSAAIPAGCS